MFLVLLWKVFWSCFTLFIKRPLTICIYSLQILSVENCNKYSNNKANRVKRSHIRLFLCWNGSSLHSDKGVLEIASCFQLRIVFHPITLRCLGNRTVLLESANLCRNVCITFVNQYIYQCILRDNIRMCLELCSIKPKRFCYSRC